MGSLKRLSSFSTRRVMRSGMGLLLRYGVYLPQLPANGSPNLAATVPFLLHQGLHGSLLRCPALLSQRGPRGDVPNYEGRAGRTIRLPEIHNIFSP